MPRKQPGPPCVVCGKSSIARELCAMHYKRFQRHGHVEQTRPEDWGLKTKHPLSGTWHWTHRQGRVPRWDDFWKFLADVGERPTEGHWLKRQQNSKPFGPKNWYWADTIAFIPGGVNRASKNQYMKEWRKKNPLRVKNSYLKRYGLTIADYNAMLEKQGGRCAICGQKDTWFSLAVDHCHGRKIVRELLCSQCNRGIGLFKDNPDLLERAAQYLRRHQCA